VTPCFSSEGINYLHIRHNNLYRTLRFVARPGARELMQARWSSRRADEEELECGGAVDVPPQARFCTRGV
jgi:hypothetical protein